MSHIEKWLRISSPAAFIFFVVSPLDFISFYSFKISQFHARALSVYVLFNYSSILNVKRENPIIMELHLIQLWGIILHGAV